MVRCQGTSVTNDVKPVIYMGFVVTVSIALIVICIMVLDAIGKDTTNACGGDTVKSSVTILLVLASILFVTSIAFTIMRSRHIFTEIL